MTLQTKTCEQLCCSAVTCTAITDWVGVIWCSTQEKTDMGREPGTMASASTMQQKEHHQLD